MKILKIKKSLNEAIISIKNGQVLICPTDTVYGLICDAGNNKEVEKIYQIKQRPKNKLMPIFVSDIKMAKKLAEINKKQEGFLKKVWPGTVTAILKSKNVKGTIGVRIPNYKWLLGLAEQLNQPLAETSANISGEPATTKIKEVLKYFKGREYHPDLAIDAGNLKKSRPSKVIDLTVWPPKILRE